MNNLPQELTDHLASFLEHDDLRNVLYVSQTFRYAAERFSGAFSHFTFENKEQGLDEYTKFVKTFSGRRLSYLRYIEVHTRFPTLFPKSYGRTCWDNIPEDIPCRESEQELREKDGIFTSQIYRAFTAIKAIEDHSINSPGRIQLVITTPIRWVDKGYCLHRVHSAWRVRLVSPSTFPQLTSIRGLSLCNPSFDSVLSISPYRYYRDNGSYAGKPYCAESKVNWRILIDLATKCPNLEYLGSRLGKYECQSVMSDDDPINAHFQNDYVGCSRDSRHDFAMTLDSAVLPTTLRYVQLDFLHDYNCDQRNGAPDISGPSPRHYDYFSFSLRKLSANLRRLELRVIADQTLFWPTADDSDIPSWTNLEKINVMFDIAAPSGSWYFHGPNGEGAHDIGYPVTSSMYPPLTDNAHPGDNLWHYEKHHTDFASSVPKLRVVPNDENIVPFLSSFAKAAANMHALQTAVLWAPIVINPGNIEGFTLDHTTSNIRCHLGWGVAYASPGQPAPIFTHHYLLVDQLVNCEERFQTYLDQHKSTISESRQIWWKVGHWRPSACLHQEFQAIGYQKHRQKLIERWQDDVYSEQLLPAEPFDDATLFKEGDEYPALFRRHGGSRL